MPSETQIIVLLPFICLCSDCDLVCGSCFLQRRALALREAGVFRNDEGGLFANDIVSHQLLWYSWLSGSYCWPLQRTNKPSQYV